ncbi:MAG: hypothetical protein IJ415_04635 [Clostridia bacterium]|nr:hypothetical protein [Clostridia bacterium]
MKKEIKALSNKCSGCGDDIIFNPDLNCVVCPSCKQTKSIKPNSQYSKHGVENKADLLDKNNEWASQNKTMSCPNCGAQVVLNKFQASSNCPYCNSELVASMEKFTGLKPDAIIPFKFGKEKAIEMFKEKIKNKWLVPSKFKKSISAKEVHAYYFPTFIFEADCHTRYEGRLYETYTVKDKDGNSETRRRYFNISGIKDTKHEGIEVEASTKLTQYELNLVRPYDKKQAQAYTDEYVYGFDLEYYSNSVNETYTQAQTIMKQDIKNQILRGYNYDGVDSFTMFNEFSNPKYSYVMLPMYRINYSYKNKNYSNIMNGQTGALGGDYPKSALKISMIVLLIMLAFLLPTIIILLNVL